MFVNPTTPNLTDFLTYVRDQGITTAQLPDASDYLTYSLNYGMETVISLSIGGVPAITGAATPYVMAVYNLSMHYLLLITPDQSSQTFFETYRANYDLNSIKTGVVSGSYDQSTGQSLVVPEFFKNLTMEQLNLTQTKYGRLYMWYAQKYGQYIVDYS